MDIKEKAKEYADGKALEAITSVDRRDRYLISYEKS